MFTFFMSMEKNTYEKLYLVKTNQVLYFEEQIFPSTFDLTP
ncbi:hypothetical protein MTP04_21810 [Lysinibacillus sp. PLM2]|nr:hypothetical protein MTP04_21810 [Lysinibacillus sp. PLM2]